MLLVLQYEEQELSVRFLTILATILARPAIWNHGLGYTISSIGPLLVSGWPGRNSEGMRFSDRLFLSMRDYANQIGQPCGIHIAYSDPIEITCPETDYMKPGMIR